MKSSRLLKYFEQYVKKFDMNNSSIKIKYFHSLKIMELARDIASSLNVFTEEEIVVCELIALFHDIGSFENIGTYHMIDEDNNDYTMRSIEILFDKKLIRDITKETKYDNIIKIALYCHNKDGLPSRLDEKTKYFCMVLKDSHKIESFRIAINYPYIDTRISTYPTEMVYDVFKKFKRVEVKLSENNADDVLIVLSGIFDLNFKYSYEVIYNNNYIDKMINSLTFEDRKIEKFFRQIGKVLFNYINRQMIGVTN